MTSYRARRAWVLGLLTVFAVPLISWTAGAREPAAAPAPRELWLYYPTNLLVEKNIEKAREVWTRAAKAGYTHVLLADAKFSRLADMDQRYFDHCDRIKRLAAELKLTVVPAVFGVGYSNDLLSRDPNLAEGLAVKDALFVVGKGGVAQLKADPPVALREKWGFVDAGVTLDPAARVATVAGHADNARMNQKVAVRPNRHYHVSVQVRTDGYTGRPEVKALAGGLSLNWTHLKTKPTQDWTTHHVTFNSLGNEEVTLYFGSWGAGTGTLQWRDWRIEEVGLLNVLRRPGAPLVVRQGDRALEEGKDFEPVADPKLGRVPFAGSYDVWHEYPGIRTKGLAEGTELRVSWYHPHLVHDEQMVCCVGEPKLKEVLADEARRMRAVWNAGGYMMSHDEIRVMNQDPGCRQHGKTPGHLLADNARFCTTLLEGATAYVWNDMFDPFHNAVRGPYYLVDGPLTDAWEGLDKSVVVVNWNFGKRDQSLKFFADRGHRQLIAGYYDHEPGQVKQWLASAAKVGGVVGVMYTTWRNDYSQMEAFARLARE
jgi:hypothetical protein